MNANILLNLVGGGANLQSTLTQYIQQNYGNNPEMMQLIQMANNNDVQSLQQIANNLLSKQGKDYNQEMSNLMNMFKRS